MCTFVKEECEIGLNSTAKASPSLDSLSLGSLGPERLTAVRVASVPGAVLFG